MDIQTSTQLAYGRASNLDSSIFYMGSVMSFLATGADTGGRFSLMEYRSQPGHEPPPHLHLWEHELYYVLEGVMEVYCDGKIILAHPGEVAFVPQGKAHAFYVRSPQFRMLALSQAVDDRAVGLDEYFVDMGTQALSMELPKEAITYQMDDPEHAIRVAGDHGVRFLSAAEIARDLPQYPGFGVPRAMIDADTLPLAA